MRGDPHQAARRARRLLRCYPPVWRARYGEEFAQLLVDDFAERPRSARRTVDVVFSGLLARLARAGILGDALEPEGQMRASVVLLAGAVSVFLVFGIAIWSQLTIGWQWSAPGSPATRAAMLLMSGAVGACAVLAILAAPPLVWTIVTGLRRREGRTWLPALGAIAVGLATLIIGSIHFGHGWPGIGGHAWSGRDVVPAAVARFCWAATLWMTSYWAHPGRLAVFPISELVWMVASPMALLAALRGSARVLRTVPISARTLRYVLCLGTGAAVAMALLLGGASSWIISGGSAPRGLFRVGAIDAVALTAMSASLMLGVRALRRGLARCPEDRIPA